MLSALFSIDHWLFGWRFYWTCSGRVSDSLIHWFMIHWPIIDSLLLYHRRTESGSLADWFGLLCLASLNYCRCLIVSLMSCFLGALKYWAMLCWIHWPYHWFGALRIWFADPSLHRFWSIACAVGLIVLWFIDPRIRTHWFDASPPIDQRARATEPLGHWATKPPGHRAPATKGLKFVGESDGIWALRRLLYQIRSPSWWSHCWGKSRWFIGSWFWFLNSWMCCVIGASACIHCFICNWHIDPLMWCCTLTCWSFCNHCSMNSKFEWLIFPSFEVIDASMHWAIDSLHRFMDQLFRVSIADLLLRILAS